MRTRELSLGSFAVLLLLTWALVFSAIVPIKTVATQPVENNPSNAMWVDPSSTGNLQKGDTFTVDIYLNVTAALMNPNATGLYAWEFKLYYKNGKLNCTGFTDYLPYADWNSPNSFVAGAGVQQNFNATHGRYWRGISALPIQSPYPTPFVGVMSICTLTFEVIDQPTMPEPPYTGPLSLCDTVLGDNSPGGFSHTAHNGTYTILPIGNIHDIAISGVFLYRDFSWDGLPAQINVTVTNQGDFAETVNVTVYANTTVIHTETVILSNRTSTTITVIWNTTGIAYGDYIISANATTVSGETDTGDNTYVDGSLSVTVIGDLDGSGAVDILDILIISVAFGSTPEDPNWNPGADVAEPWGEINILDILLVAVHFGESV